MAAAFLIREGYNTEIVLISLIVILFINYNRKFEWKVQDDSLKHFRYICNLAQKLQL